MNYQDEGKIAPTQICRAWVSPIQTSSDQRTSLSVNPGAVNE